MKKEFEELSLDNLIKMFEILMDSKNIELPEGISPLFIEGENDEFTNNLIEQLENYLGPLIAELRDKLPEIDKQLDADEFPESRNPFDDLFDPPGEASKDEITLGCYHPYFPEEKKGDLDFSFALGYPNPRQSGNVFFRIKYPGRAYLANSLIQLKQDRIMKLGAWLYHFSCYHAPRFQMIYFRLICYCVAFYYVLYHEIGHYLVQNALIKLAYSHTNLAPHLKPYDLYRTYARSTPKFADTFEEAFVEAYTISALTRKNAWHEIESCWGNIFTMNLGKVQEYIRWFNDFHIRFLLYLLFRLKRKYPYAGFVNWLVAPWRFFLFEPYINKYLHFRDLLQLKPWLQLRINIHERAFYSLQYNFQLAINAGTPNILRAQIKNDYNLYYPFFRNNFNPFPPKYFPDILNLTRNFNFNLLPYEYYLIAIYNEISQYPLNPTQPIALPNKVQLNFSLGVIKNQWDIVSNKLINRTRLHGSTIKMDYSVREFNIAPTSTIIAKDEDSFPILKVLQISNDDFPLFCDANNNPWPFKNKNWIVVPPPKIEII